MVQKIVVLLIEKQKKEQYKLAMIEASKDKQYLEDMKIIENDFKYSDYENIRWINMMSINTVMPTN